MRPHNLPFLHLAAASKADMLVSGDAHLLTPSGKDVRTRVGLRILNVQALLEYLTSSAVNDP